MIPRHIIHYSNTKTMHTKEWHATKYYEPVLIQWFSLPIENLFCMKKIIRRTVPLERMKVNLVIFNVRFIFQLTNEIDATTV